MIHTYNAILVSLKKGDPAICNNRDETGGLYAKWNNAKRKILHNVTYIQNLKKKKNWFSEAESRKVGEMKDVGQRVQNCSCVGWISSRGLMYSMMTIVNIAVMYTRSLLRFQKLSPKKS